MSLGSVAAAKIRGSRIRVKGQLRSLQQQEPDVSVCPDSLSSGPHGATQRDIACGVGCIQNTGLGGPQSRRWEGPSLPPAAAAAIWIPRERDHACLLLHGETLSPPSKAADHTDAEDTAEPGSQHLSRRRKWERPAENRFPVVYPYPFRGPFYLLEAIQWNDKETGGSQKCHGSRTILHPSRASRGNASTGPPLPRWGLIIKPSARF